MTQCLSNISKDALHDYLMIGRPDLDKILRKPEAFYREFQIQTKGKLRTIWPPITPLKEIQRTLLHGFYRQTRWLSCLHGGVPGRSVISNARPHLGQHLVSTYDIKDFFPSTTDEMVRQCFVSMHFAPEMAEILTRLATFNGSLPLGAPTSTAIANLVFKPSDLRLLRLCRIHNLTYTRYVDDIFISGDKDFRDLSQAIRGNIELLGYRVNEKKVNHFFEHQRQIVTGLVVNKILSPTQLFLGETKTLIRRCHAPEGPAAVADEYGLTIQQFRQMISGRISFVKSVYRKRGRALRGLLVGISWS